MRNAHKILDGECEENSPLGKRRHSWKDSIKIYIKETECDNVDRLNLVLNRDQQWALMNTLMNFRFPLKAGQLSVP
jgi:hypothetical protein